MYKTPLITELTGYVLLLQVGDSEDRKKALDSGLLTVVVKLLQSHHPLPVRLSVCLVH